MSASQLESPSYREANRILICAPVEMKQSPGASSSLRNPQPTRFAETVIPSGYLANHKVTKLPKDWHPLPGKADLMDLPQDSGHTSSKKTVKVWHVDVREQAGERYWLPVSEAVLDRAHFADGTSRYPWKIRPSQNGPRHRFTLGVKDFTSYYPSSKWVCYRAKRRSQDGWDHLLLVSEQDANRFEVALRSAADVDQRSRAPVSAQPPLNAAAYRPALAMIQPGPQMMLPGLPQWYSSCFDVKHAQAKGQRAFYPDGETYTAANLGPVSQSHPLRKWMNGNPVYSVPSAKGDGSRPVMTPIILMYVNPESNDWEVYTAGRSVPDTNFVQNYPQSDWKFYLAVPKQDTGEAAGWTHYLLVRRENRRNLRPDEIQSFRRAGSAGMFTGLPKANETMGRPKRPGIPERGSSVVAPPVPTPAGPSRQVPDGRTPGVQGLNEGSVPILRKPIPPNRRNGTLRTGSGSSNVIGKARV